MPRGALSTGVQCGQVSSCHPPKVCPEASQSRICGAPGEVVCTGTTLEKHSLWLAPEEQTWLQVRQCWWMVSV